jgi:hypothetical protein
MRCLASALALLPEAAIIWPNAARIDELGALIATSVPQLRNAFGAVDGSLFSIPRPHGAAQRIYYTQYKKKHAAKCLMVFGPDGCILHAAYNLPGAWHDSMAAAVGGLYHHLAVAVPQGKFLLGDSAFIRGPHVLDTATARTLLGHTPEEVIILRAASKMVSKVRILVEWSFGGLKKTFQILQTRLPRTSSGRKIIFELCFHLWNYRVRTMRVGEVVRVFNLEEFGGQVSMGLFNY